MPLIVTTFPAHVPVTPAGSPVTVAPVARNEILPLASVTGLRLDRLHPGR